MNIEHYFSDNLYAKQSTFGAGSLLVQHRHKYDHLAILAQGSVEVIIDDIKHTFDAPTCINIKKDKHHGVKALTDVVWYCIHSTDCKSEEEVDQIVIQVADNANMQQIMETLKG